MIFASIRFFRRRTKFRAALALFTASVFCMYFMLAVKEYSVNKQGQKELEEALSFYNDIPESCACIDKSTSIEYNFCYRLPAKFGVPAIGKRFSCEWVPIMKQLGLLDLNPDSYFRFDRHDLPTAPPFVTAASDSYIHTELTFIRNVHEYFPPDQRIIFYDLGLSEENIQRVRRLCGVEYRRFAFEQYPPWLKVLRQYRWKPLVIAEALKEFGAIWYMDSSVKLEKGDLSHVYSLLTCRKDLNFGPFHSVVPSPALSSADFVESGFHMPHWTEAKRRCDKFAYMLQGFTGHGIFSATHPGVYTYIPTDKKRVKQERSKMYEAGHLFAVRTMEAVQDVLKWYVLCALERDCMAPLGASLFCSFDNDRYGVYAKCHRYDQSVVNVLLANRNFFDSYYWTSGIVDFFHIVRGAASDWDDDRLRYCVLDDDGISAATY